MKNQKSPEKISTKYLTSSFPWVVHYSETLVQAKPKRWYIQPKYVSLENKQRSLSSLYFPSDYHSSHNPEVRGQFR
jgi:hypothetical protein